MIMSEEEKETNLEIKKIVLKSAQTGDRKSSIAKEENACRTNQEKSKY